MIFFSDEIKNKIVDATPLDEIIDKLEEFKNDKEMIFTYFNYGAIAIDYIQNLLKYESNKTAFYCTEDNFVIRSCPSCMIYSRQNKKKVGTKKVTKYKDVVVGQKEEKYEENGIVDYRNEEYEEKGRK